MKDTECPYCRKGVDIDHDDHGDVEDEKFEGKCPECHKSFIYMVVVSLDFRTGRADCLNGADHKYEKTKTIPVEFSRNECKDCGDVLPLTEAEAMLRLKYRLHAMSKARRENQ